MNGALRRPAQRHPVLKPALNHRNCEIAFLTMKPTLPAEWAPQSAVMLTWPHAGTDWADKLDAVQPVFTAIAHAILDHAHLIVSCEDVFALQRIQAELGRYARESGCGHGVIAVPAPADDTWARDNGPITVLVDGQPRLMDFGFNAWGGKFPWQKDNALNSHLARQHAFGRTPLKTVDFILEGGSIESDGQGTLLTTSQCLLTPTRNPGYSKADVEARLSEYLGFDRFLWLDHGYLAGDDTDSHIDTLARFCSPERICYVRCPDQDDEHYEALQAMEAELKAFRQRDGRPYELVPLPWPEAIHDEDGQRLPATYANFLILNDAVLLPIYDVPQDQAAIEALQRCFPTHQIVPVNCRIIIEQHGSLHCLTMQLPEGVVES